MPTQSKTTALALRRDASVTVPREVLIPATLEDAQLVLEGVGALLTATQWGTAAIVYAFTSGGEKSSQVPDEAFAGLGIRGLTTRDTVRKYRRAWASAIDDGMAEPCEPGDTVELPVGPFNSEGSNAHVSNNSGDNEWYTPPEYVAAARVVMGGIDLDPASTPEANEVVDAAAIYTKDDDGLRYPWAGRVWMNPPYARPLVDQFCAKLAGEIKKKNVSQACALVNNATETGWFHLLAGEASAICFPLHRVQFWKNEPGEKGAPLQGQSVLYFGTNTDDFRAEFLRFGFTVAL